MSKQVGSDLFEKALHLIEKDLEKIMEDEKYEQELISKLDLGDVDKPKHR